MACSHSSNDRPIVLVGMMGSGKSSVGQVLGARLRLPFQDSDAAVVAESGRTVAALFEQEGEAGFRERERRAVAALVDGPRCVIATGGGAVEDAGTRALLRDAALTIWLDADPVQLLERLRGTADRPLLSGPDPLAVLTRLSERRRPFYSEASIRIAASEGSAEAVAERALAALARL